MQLLSPIVAAKTNIECHRISPGIHAGVAFEQAASAEQYGMLQSALGRGRIMPWMVSASTDRQAKLRRSLGRGSRLPLNPGLKAGAIRMIGGPLLQPCR
jgi:hypothetical protein